MNIDILRILRKKLFPKKYYLKYLSHFDSQLFHKVNTQKQNKKYIPDVFLELDEIKDSLRYFVNPMVFYEKIISELNLLDFSFFNDLYKKIGINSKKLTFNFNPSVKTLSDLANSVNSILNEFNKINTPVVERNEISKDNSDLIIKNEGMDRRIGWVLDYYSEQIELLYNKRIYVLTEKAGQGKTNLICDFVEKYVISNKIPAVFLTGNQLVSNATISFENIISKELSPFSSHLGLKELLNDINHLCYKKNCYFTIIIDGINEVNNIESFHSTLYKFTEDVLKYPYIKLIYTCRSEYFKERFPNFANSPSFERELLCKTDYMSICYNSNEPPEYFIKKLIPSYFSFFGVKNDVSIEVKRELVSDFLLLRVFCEVFGYNFNPNADSITPIYDLYKDDLFKSYFEHKIRQIEIISPDSRRKYVDILTKVLEYMCSNCVFVNIPFAVVKDCDTEYLIKLTHEDILFRTDLILDETSILGNCEVLNFTFDEFRDYLIVDYILKNTCFNIKEFIIKIGAEDYNPLIHDYLYQKSVILEGVMKFFFFKSRRNEYRDRLSFLSDLKCYNLVFSLNIFSVNESYITDDDLSLLKELIICNDNSKKYLFKGLLSRIDSIVYPKMNIKILTDLFFNLTETKYEEIVNDFFKVTIEYHYSQRSLKGYINSVIKYYTEIIEIKSNEAFPTVNIIEFILSLSAVDGTGYGTCNHQLKALVKDFLKNHPIEGTKMLYNYSHTPNRHLSNEIWNFISFMYHSSILKMDVIPKEGVKKFEEKLLYVHKKDNINDLSMVELIKRFRK